MGRMSMTAVDDKNQAVDLVAINSVLRLDQVVPKPDFILSGTISSKAANRSQMVSSSNGVESSISILDRCEARVPSDSGLVIMMRAGNQLWRFFRMR